MRSTLLLILCLISLGGASSNLRAPDFRLMSSSGDYLSLSDRLKESNYVVLVFYPKNDSPVCTKQLCELRDNYDSLLERGVTVLGISSGTLAEHRAFAESQGYQFELLVDDGSVSSAYGSRGLLGGVVRRVFIIDSDQNIIFSQRGRPSSDFLLEVIESKK